MHTTNIFSPDQIPLRIFALLCTMCGFENCGTKLIIQPKDVRKPVRRRELLNYYIKEIKLYVVISTITSSKKKFQQLYFNWRFGMPLISKKKHQKLYFKWRFEMPIISSQFPLKAAICFICNVLGYQFSGNFSIKKIHLWITLGSWFPYTCTYSLQFFVRSSQRFWYKKLNHKLITKTLQ